MEDYPKTLLDFAGRFATEEACLEYLFKMRWPRRDFGAYAVGTREHGPQTEVCTVVPVVISKPLLPLVQFFKIQNCRCGFGFGPSGT